MLIGLEHLSNDDSLRQLRLFLLEKKRLWGDLLASSRTKMEPIRKMGTNVLAGPVLIRQNGFKQKEGTWIRY